MITGDRDGNISFWNVRENYKLLSKVNIDEEIGTILYWNSQINKVTVPFLIIGGSSGTIKVFDIKQ